MGRRSQQPGSLMRWDYLGTRGLRSKGVRVSRWPEKRLCVGRGTRRPSLGREHLPGLGEKHPPPSCLCCLSCYRECKPSAACSSSDQIKKRDERIGCNKGKAFERHHFGLSCSSNDNFCGGHQTVQFFYSCRMVFLLCMFFKAFWTISFTILFGVGGELLFFFLITVKEPLKIRRTIHIYRRHSSHFLILES